MNTTHQKLASPRLQSSVKDFSSFPEEYCSVKRNLKPSEAEGDIFKDSGMYTAILVSNLVNVTLLTETKQTKACPAISQQGAKLHSVHYTGFSDNIFNKKNYYNTTHKYY